MAQDSRESGSSRARGTSSDDVDIPDPPPQTCLNPEVLQDPLADDTLVSEGVSDTRHPEEEALPFLPEDHHGHHQDEGASEASSPTASTSGLSTNANRDVRRAEFPLRDFALHIGKASCGQQVLLSPSNIVTRTGRIKKFVFVNGKLSADGEKVETLGVKDIYLEKYHDFSVHTVREYIWLRVRKGKRLIDCQLDQPAEAYWKYFRPFLWVADLCKHFVGYLRSQENVSIRHFKENFRHWLLDVHQNHEDIQNWFLVLGTGDLRTAVVANLSFLYRESARALRNREMYHDIWKELLGLGAPPHTLVTQDVYNLFQGMAWREYLECISLNQSTKSLRDSVIQERFLKPLLSVKISLESSAAEQSFDATDIRPGHTISIPGDSNEVLSADKRAKGRGISVGRKRRYGLVQRVCPGEGGRKAFDMIWYYWPADTPCGIMEYPWTNEIFLSDHCTCKDEKKVFWDNEALRRHNVQYGGLPTADQELFCRQTYLHNERKWVTIQKEHLTCRHDNIERYEIGDTVLVRLQGNARVSQPCVIEHCFPRAYTLRRLFRRRAIEPPAPNAAPNELVYSEELVGASEEDIIGSCAVGNNGILKPVSMDTIPKPMKQGPDPRAKTRSLRGLDLFCGGGNFGRGLEEGGGITMRWANDNDPDALRTYMANTSEENEVCPCLNSIDDWQRQIMEGRVSDLLPNIGDVEFISAGTPCPGFSNLTKDKKTPQQRKNQSLVAAFASAVDLYRPLYGLLENVTGMILRGDDKAEDVLRQFICFIVSLGYQAQAFLLVASGYGTAQDRPRVFVSFAAPGLCMPQTPLQTHSYREDMREDSLGRLPSGRPMIERPSAESTPFSFISAKEATAGLPSMQDGEPDICVPFPDHRVVAGMTKQMREMISLIPPGRSLSDVWNTLLEDQRNLFSPAVRQSVSKAFGRVNPDRPFETITTKLPIAHRWGGRWLHWEEQRLISVAEVRRAQGFLDGEVILGSTATQLRIVGNSVPREVSLALGAVFRDAWVKSQAKMGATQAERQAGSAADRPVAQSSTRSSTAPEAS